MQKLKNTFDFGANLRVLRKKHDFTQERLTAQLNLRGIDIDRSKYSRYETGELNVPIEVIMALHDIYRCSYDDFFS